MPPVKARRNSAPPLTHQKVDNAQRVDNAPEAPTPALPTTKEVYSRQSMLTHVLERPDSYVGSITPEDMTAWVYLSPGPDESNEPRLVQRSVRVAFGFLKIFDEILVNARDRRFRDPLMNAIKVAVDAEAGVISVWNNGAGVPVRLHETEGIYIPELIFGSFMAGSNFDDTETRFTGGRNGLGSSLTSAFSLRFELSTLDTEVKKLYQQTWRRNMSVMEPPKITSSALKGGYTQITYEPDVARFGMSLPLSGDVVALLRRRALDMAGILPGVRVVFNEETLKLASFKKYCELYQPQGLIMDEPAERWQVGVASSPDGFQHVSFVNGIATSLGGTHVEHVTTQVVTAVVEHLAKKKVEVKPAQVRQHLGVFVNCLLVNPSFSSQTKECCTLPVKGFGSRWTPSEGFLAKLVKSDLVATVLEKKAVKDEQSLKKTDGSKTVRLTGIPKLEDAAYAGTKQSHLCNLYLAEGDSAKALVVAGFGVIGRDYAGCMPLLGKPLNVRDVSAKSVSENAEFNAIKKILGLQQSKLYTDVSTLRYGRVTLCCDFDFDGFHISGILTNYFERFFPSLLRLPGFLNIFISPIVKATKGTEVLSFFSIPEYQKWRAHIVNPAPWYIKNFKGLGTSTSADARQYFSNIDFHLKKFEPLDDQDQASLDLAFSKKRADDRKTWIADYVPGTSLDFSQSEIKIEDFVNKQLIQFSCADNERSIPSVVDGLKVSQRKILFGCFKTKIDNEMKVAQLGSLVANLASYHHGENSLSQAIICMAQDYVGSASINLLEPRGQFGTRLAGGKDSASPRYIFTALSPITRLLYPVEDDAILSYLEDDGQSIEPKWYIPILPTLLCYLVQGIGTGWSTNVPTYNPLDLVSAVRSMLKGGSTTAPLSPWVRGFKGTIESLGAGKWKTRGLWKRVGLTLEISELPVGTWTQVAKELIDEMSIAGEIVKSFTEHHTDTTVLFKIALAREMTDDEIETTFKLSSILNTNNMVAFDADGKIQRYATAEDVLKAFFPIRLEMYARRREVVLERLRKELGWAKDKSAFIRMVVDGTFTFFQKSKDQLHALLESTGLSAHGDELLKLPMSSLTLENAAGLDKITQTKEAEVAAMERATPQHLWSADLDTFEAAWNRDVARRDLELGCEVGAIAGPQPVKPKVVRKSAPPKSKA